MPTTIRAPHGTELSTKGWLQEAALRMLMNNLDPDVAENPDELVVYGGRGGVLQGVRDGKSFVDYLDAALRNAAETGAVDE